MAKHTASQLSQHLDSLGVLGLQLDALWEVLAIVGVLGRHVVLSSSSTLSGLGSNLLVDGLELLCGLRIVLQGLGALLGLQ